VDAIKGYIVFSSAIHEKWESTPNFDPITIAFYVVE
jgi:hypothetical protein